MGCHTENPLWPAWRPILEEQGLPVYDHSPLSILEQAERAGLSTAVQPLRTQGWVLLEPSRMRFPVASLTSLLDHHYRHKLLFCFTKPSIAQS
jgi:hypothetical protein